MCLPCNSQLLQDSASTTSTGCFPSKLLNVHCLPHVGSLPREYYSITIISTIGTGTSTSESLRLNSLSSNKRGTRWKRKNRTLGFFPIVDSFQLHGPTLSKCVPTFFCLTKHVDALADLSMSEKHDPPQAYSVTTTTRTTPLIVVLFTGQTYPTTENPRYPNPGPLYAAVCNAYIQSVPLPCWRYYGARFFVLLVNSSIEVKTAVSCCCRPSSLKTIVAQRQNENERRHQFPHRQSVEFTSHGLPSSINMITYYR